MVYAALAIGSHVVPVTPVIPSQLYWDVCIPKLCYGIVTSNVLEGTIINMDTLKFAVKHIQGAPDNTSNYGSIVTAGWKCTCVI